MNPISKFIYRRAQHIVAELRQCHDENTVRYKLKLIAGLMVSGAVILGLITAATLITAMLHRGGGGNGIQYLLVGYFSFTTIWFSFIALVFYRAMKMTENNPYRT